MQLKLIYCAFGRHAYGRINHDDMLERWIQICRLCGTVKKVDAPRNEHGMNYTSHEWLDLENKRSADELSALVEKYKKEL